MQRGRSAQFGISIVAAVSGSCSDEDLAQPLATVPRIVAATTAANPHLALSAVVVFTAERSDSARVICLAENLPADSTPYTRVSEGTDTIVVLGLRPATTYRNVVEVVGPEGRAQSDTLLFTTGTLPDVLQRVGIHTTGSGGQGLTLTSMQVGGNGVFAVGFDAAGDIRWYRRFEGAERFGGELKQQSNGNFTLYRGSSTGVEKVPGHFVEFTPAGDSVRAISVAPPRYLDNHDFWITTGLDGSERFHFFTYDHRVSDLTELGGSDSVALAGHQLVRLRSDGSTELEWNAWDRLSLPEWIEPPRPDPDDHTARDFDHPNSLSFDRDGNYIVSFRHLGQVMKIDAETGEVIWRLGGVNNEFTFLNDPLNGFSAQHSARILRNGNLLLYDNGTSHPSPESRAVEYALDTIARTATLVWEFRHLPPIYTPSVGGVQRLQNGNTLVGYGFMGRAVEVGQNGNITWAADVTLDGQSAFVYRLIRIGSLYQYQVP